MKSSQSNHNVVVLVENYDQGIKVYYSDGHHEIKNQRIQEYERIRSHKYKNPILFETSLLFPTQNQKDYQCKWINLKYLEKKDTSYIDLLKEKGLDIKSIKMYLQHKDELLKDGF